MAVVAYLSQLAGSIRGSDPVRSKTATMNQRNRPYAQALQRLSARTGTPLSSLVVSFGILHEVTALVPLVGVFFGARAVGAGDRAIELVPSDWVQEGEDWAGRVGSAYNTAFS
ncbi:hypothetical protein ACGC1H_004136 [Rhizoctonia solani]